MLKTADPNAAQQQWMEELKRFLGGGLLVGAGARAVPELLGMANRAMTPRPKLPQPMLVNVPYRLKREPEDEEELPALPKVANQQPDPLGFVLGNQAIKKEDIPAYLPSMFWGVPAAAYGGWKLTDALLKRRRRNNLQQDLDEAKEDLTAAQLGQAKPLQLDKVASACKAILTDKEPEDEAWQKAGAAIGRLAKVALAKKADLEPADALPWNWPVLKNLPWGRMAGIYGTLAIPAALGTGAYAYNMTRATDPERLKAKAVRDQLEQLNLSQQPPLFARLVHVNRQGQPDKQPKKEAPDLDKQAAAFVKRLIGK